MKGFYKLIEHLEEKPKVKKRDFRNDNDSNEYMEKYYRHSLVKCYFSKNEN